MGQGMIGTLAAALLVVVAAAAGPGAAQVAADPSADPAGPAASGAVAPAGEDDGDEDDDGAAPGSASGTAAAPVPGGPAPGAPPAAHHDYGPSGIMVRSNREDLPPLTLAAGRPVAGGEYQLRSGGYYRIDIVADGSAELALSGGDFFRAVWVNEVVVNDIEVRPTGLHSLEFDAAGTATLSFVAIQPGRYVLSIPGSTGATQQAVFVIR